MRGFACMSSVGAWGRVHEQRAGLRLSPMWMETRMTFRHMETMCLGVVQ